MGVMHRFIIDAQQRNAQVLDGFIQLGLRRTISGLPQQYLTLFPHLTKVVDGYLGSFLELLPYSDLGAASDIASLSSRLFSQLMRRILCNQKHLPAHCLSRQKSGLLNVAFLRTL